MTRRPSQGSRPITFVLLACLLWGIPVAISLLVRPSRVERETLWPSDLQMRTALVGERSDDGAQAATLQLEWSAPSSVTLPSGVTGVVTDVWIQEGSAVEDGSPLVSVDGIARLAQTTGQPTYREIRSGDSGPDVQWLDALLVRMGAAPSPTLDADGRATWGTAQAIKELQKWIGANPDGVFRPEYTVSARVPGEEGATSTVVGSVSTAVGAQATSGTEIFRTATGLEQARIQLDAAPSRQALLREVPLSMTVGGTTVELSGLDLSSDDLHVLEGVFDSTTTDVDSVVLRRRAPFRPGAVPSSAVIPLEAGRGCLIVVTAESYEPRRFSLLSESSSEPGVSYVPSDLIGQTVVTNPSQDLASQCA